MSTDREADNLRYISYSAAMKDQITAAQSPDFVDDQKMGFRDWVAQTVNNKLTGYELDYAQQDWQDAKKGDIFSVRRIKRAIIKGGRGHRPIDFPTKI